jgi:hypothetical protein
MKHRKTLLMADEPDATKMRPSDWNDWHALPAYTVATLPTPGIAGRLAWVTDGASPVYLDTGTSWISIGLASGGAAEDAWPIGSLFISAVATNPSVLLGFGTWERYKQGFALVSLADGDGDFGTIGAEVGAKTHTLITTEMPVHTHVVTDPGHTHPVPVGGASSGAGLATGNVSSYEYRVQSNTTGITMQNAGGGAAHNNIQPSTPVYVWKRTA